MKILVADGDDLIADSAALGSFEKTCAAFEAYLQKRFFADN